MQIDGITVTYLSDWDGLPVKNHLPVELRDRMKTANQWLELGYLPKEKATKYELHPSALSKRIFVYYLDTDVEKMTDATTPKSCMTCSIRTGRYCPVAGDYVGVNGRCSEWDPIDA